MRGLNVDNRELELTSNCTIPEISRGRRHASSSESNFSTSPASSTLPLPDFHQPHSHVNRSYTNTYSSCSSFKLPNIIGKKNHKIHSCLQFFYLLRFELACSFCISEYPQSLVYILCFLHYQTFLTIDNMVLEQDDVTKLFSTFFTSIFHFFMFNFLVIP